jgi:anti-sigma factor RsiW
MNTTPPPPDTPHPQDPLPASQDDARVELAMLVSASLDGESAPGDTARMQAILAAYPDLASVAANMTALQGALQQWESTTLNALPPAAAMWQAIQSELSSDLDPSQGVPAALINDWETCSAYYDGALPPAQRNAFEAQLPQNQTANQHLQDIASVSEAYQAFGTGLEATCTLDVAHAVAQQVAADADTLELLSAYWDGELDAKANKRAIQLLDNDLDAKSYMQALTTVSDGLQRITDFVSTASPDCWPAIQASLLADPEFAGVRKPAHNVMLLTPDSKAATHSSAATSPKGKLLRFAVPLTSAAAVLLMLLYPLQSALNSQNTLAQKGHPRADRTVIASAPVELMGRALLDAPSAGSTEPVQDDGNQVANINASDLDGHNAMTEGDVIPSAEAYMLQATNTENPSNSEYAVMMGGSR